MPLTEIPPRGTVVQRCNHPNGNPPEYRFKGVVCGEYENPYSGKKGLCVASEAEPGCIQIFPLHMLEVV